MSKIGNGENYIRIKIKITSKDSILIRKVTNNDTRQYI